MGDTSIATSPAKIGAPHTTRIGERTWFVEKNRACRLHIDSISRNRFHIESTTGLLFLCTVPASRWINKNGKYECGGHQSRNEVKGLIVVSIDLPQISEQQRSEGGGECPWQHH